MPLPRSRPRSGQAAAPHTVPRPEPARRHQVAPAPLVSDNASLSACERFHGQTSCLRPSASTAVCQRQSTALPYIRISTRGRTSARHVIIHGRFHGAHCASQRFQCRASVSSRLLERCISAHLPRTALDPHTRARHDCALRHRVHRVASTRPCTSRVLLAHHSPRLHASRPHLRVLHRPTLAYNRDPPRAYIGHLPLLHARALASHGAV
ncbi:hypothetical protein FB451DRAFT_1404964 [Mycena latifolia]|nr:hypothetical protein FB451DRAFT_1404964 [Mycena latifolia]